MRIPPGESPLPVGLVGAWEAFFERQDRPLPGRACYPIFNDPILFPLQRKREMEAMLELAGGAGVVMEIGADKGGSLYHWCCQPSVKKVIGIEIRGVPYAHLFRKNFPHIEFLLLDESSYDDPTVRRVAEFLGNDSIDVAFLDGDKANYDKDFWAYSLFVRSGGLVLLHDINDDIAPSRFFKSLDKQFSPRSIIDVAEGEEALTRKAMGAPARSAHEEWLYHWGITSCGVGVVTIP